MQSETIGGFERSVTIRGIFFGFIGKSTGFLIDFPLEFL